MMMVFKVFVYQPLFNMLELKKDKGTEYVIGWRSKGVYNSKLTSWHGTFLPNMKYFGQKIGIQFKNTSLVVEQNNYMTKAVDAHIAYDLDNWPKIPFRNFTLKNCLFGVINIEKDNDRSKHVYSGYGIAFDGKVSQILVTTLLEML